MTSTLEAAQMIQSTMDISDSEDTSHLGSSSFRKFSARLIFGGGRGGRGSGAGSKGSRSRSSKGSRRSTDNNKSPAATTAAASTTTVPTFHTSKGGGEGSSSSSSSGFASGHDLHDMIGSSRIMNNDSSHMMNNDSSRRSSAKSRGSSRGSRKFRPSFKWPLRPLGLRMPTARMSWKSLNLTKRQASTNSSRNFQEEQTHERRSRNSRREGRGPTSRGTAAAPVTECKEVYPVESAAVAAAAAAATTMPTLRRTQTDEFHFDPDAEIPPFDPKGDPSIALSEMRRSSHNNERNNKTSVKQPQPQQKRRASTLRYRTRQEGMLDDSNNQFDEFRYNMSLNNASQHSANGNGGGGMIDGSQSFRGSLQQLATPTNLLATGRSMSTLQDNFETSRSSSFKCVLEGASGMETWQSIIRPFVSDLAFNSIVTRKSESAVCFDPYTCEAAVLFVDLSGYSKITSAIAHRGAHAISSAVNAYLDRLLRIIDRYGGDVVKFAGDAVLVVWAGAKDDDDELEYNLLCASKCALELQRQAGTHAVQHTHHSFRIHCGLCCGMLESEIFAAPSHIHMQRLFHSVSGRSLADISELVDLAKSGEIAISEDVADYLGTRGTFEEIKNIRGAMLLADLELDPILEEAMDQHIIDSKRERNQRRIKGSEEDFIHPNVLRVLRFGGLSPTQIAQMRNLCVLFIAMTSSGNSVNWLMEVQGVLDRHRCPIIQIIDDDKGTHVVAAVNLCESVPESAVLGLDACRELVEKEIGCAIGVAMGSTFCGVTGSSGIACRWDITGPHPVRAARLMQYALLNKIPIAIDGSLLDDPMAATRMTVLDPMVEIKGSADPCVVYGLSGSKIYSVFRVMETTPGQVHNRAVHQVRKILNTGRTRCAVILTGAPFAGKRTVCEKAAALSDLVPFTHVCNETAGLAQLARTIAIWYSYVEDKKIQKQAKTVLEHMDKSRWSKAHDECVELVCRALEKGLRACFVIDRIQFLDSFSLSILRGCLEGKTMVNGELASTSVIQRIDPQSGLLEGNSSDSDWSKRSDRIRSSEYRKGKVVFMGCHLPLYNRKSAEELKEDITRSRRTLRVKVVEVGQSTQEEIRGLVQESFDLEPDPRWLRCHMEASGVSLAYLLKRTQAIRKISSLGAENESGAQDQVTDSLQLHIAPGRLNGCRHYPISEISADLAMKALQLFDDLPPLFQTLTKVIAIATKRASFKLPNIVVWKVMNDLYGEIDSVRFGTVIDEMKEMHLLKVEIDRNIEKMSFSTPVLADVALNVCTPSQIQLISEALLLRLESLSSHNFKVPLVMANLYQELGNDEAKMKDCWQRAYKAFLKVHKQDVRYESDFDRDWWLEYFSENITLAGFAPKEVLGTSFVLPVMPVLAAPDKMMQIKSYIAPITFGPLGHTLSMMSRTLFHLYGAHITRNEEATTKLQEELSNACKRYLKEVKTVEEFLSEIGLDETTEMLDDEKELVEHLSAPSNNADEVLARTECFLDNFVEKHVSARLERVRDYASCIKEAPEFVSSGTDRAIMKAFKKTLMKKCWKDKFEDALMIMAVRNWKPRPVPECQSLPSFYLQTICHIRDKFLKHTSLHSFGSGGTRDSIMSAGGLQRQYLFSDFQAFLVFTALLYKAEEETANRPQPPLRRNSSKSLLGTFTEESDGDIDEAE